VSLKEGGVPLEFVPQLQDGGVVGNRVVEHECFSHVCALHAEQVHAQEELERHGLLELVELELCHPVVEVE